MKRETKIIPAGTIIAIIAIFVAIAIPAYTRLQQRAKFAEANTNLGAIKTAIEGYRAKNGRYPDKIEDIFQDIGFTPQGRLRYKYSYRFMPPDSYVITATDKKSGRVYTLTKGDSTPKLQR
jgi:type II secretory pathway pseudopilin PulG